MQETHQSDVVSFNLEFADDAALPDNTNKASERLSNIDTYAVNNRLECESQKPKFNIWWSAKTE